ncbi:MAG: PAS domain S-box protein, partial [Gluconacetobacter diazotrophicus]|nr:PAS domain S-box protein [Gluconacetobacter diazotrophicus]
IVIDPDGRITDWLPGAEAVFGWTAAEAVGQHGSILFTPEDRAAGRAEEELRTALGRGVASNVRWHVRKDGTPVFIDGSVRTLHDRDDAASGFIKIGQDVTERRRSETRLRESEARLRTLMENIPQLVWRGATADGEWTWASPQWVAYTGQSDADSRGPGWLAALHPADRDTARAAWLKAEKQGQLQFDGRIRHGASGQYRWFQTLGVPVRGIDGEISEWLGTCTDIDDQVQARDLLARSSHDLERQVAERTAEVMRAEAQLRQHEKLTAIGQLTGGIAHDFNNMLQALGSSLELIRFESGSGRTAGLDTYLARAEQTAERGAALVGRMLAFSRQQALEPRPVHLDGVVLGMEDLIRRSVEPAARLEMRLRDGHWLAWCDPNQLENALLNLCLNARDAMPDGGWLTVGSEELELSADQLRRHADATPGRYVCLSVRDAGTGIPADILDRVFEPFFTTKPVGAGTGLGLSQVYGFVRQSGGLVEVDSSTEPGSRRGTTVRLYFPFHGEEASAGEARPAGPVILLVEDQPDVRLNVAQLLRSRDYRVLEAGSGPEAIRILDTAGAVDLLLTDHGLPEGMTGLQLVAAARERRTTLPAILMTGFAPPDIDPDLAVLRKPFRMASLVSAIRDALAAA